MRTPIPPPAPVLQKRNITTLIAANHASYIIFAAKKLNSLINCRKYILLPIKHSNVTKKAPFHFTRKKQENIIKNYKNY